MKRLLGFLLAALLCFGYMPHAAAEAQATGLEEDDPEGFDFGEALFSEIGNEENLFSETAERLNPGWRVIRISWFMTGDEVYYEMSLMRIADRMLRTRRIIAGAEDTAGKDWDVWDNAPIPLTEAGAAQAAAQLAAFTLSEGEYEYAVEFLADTGLLPESAGFLLNEGETLADLYAYEGYLAGIAENAAGQCSLRLADWDGKAYGPVLATPMQASFWINDDHSYSGAMEIYADTGEDHSEEWLERDDDGIWRLRVHTPGAGIRYGLTSEGLVDAQRAEYDPYYSNDAWHYGTPTFAAALPDIVFAGIPDLEEAIPLLDASGWACVKSESAPLYDSPDGTVLAGCFLRLPGRILEQRDHWTQLQIGSEELGMKGWFRTEDLAFGAETENVVCSFPSFDHEGLKDNPLTADICRRLDEDFWGLEFWLIGRTPAGDWLLLIDQRLTCTLSPALIGETGPTLHEWEDETLQDSMAFWEAEEP